jgi:lipoyl(octanoyl) transferase
VDLDLSWFEAIVPCGLADADVTSMAQQVGESPSVDAVKEALTEEFARRFGVVLEPGRTLR